MVKSSSGKVEGKTESKPASSQKEMKGIEKTLNLILIVVIIQAVLVLGLFALHFVSVSGAISAKVNSIDDKVSRIDNFFRNFVDGYDDVPAGGGGSQTPVQVNLDGVWSIGDENAPVVIVEYSSLTCPYCGRHNMETKSVILSELVETGKVRYVYKHFLRNEVDAVAAGAAECAGEQGAFFDYIYHVYINQGELSASPYLSFARELGLDENAFASCLESGSSDEKIMNDFNEARSVGVTGTPSFLINGKLFSGACPYETFSRAVEKEIAGEDWRINNCQVI